MACENYERGVVRQTVVKGFQAVVELGKGLRYPCALFFGALGRLGYLAFCVPWR